MLIGSRELSSSYFYAGNICVFLLHCCFRKSVSQCCTCHSYLVTLDSLLKTSYHISDSCNYRCVWGFPSGSVVKNPDCQCRGDGFGPWVWEDPLEEEWQPTPVFLLGKSYGQRRLAAYSSWRHKGLDTTERLSMIGVFALVNMTSSICDVPQNASPGLQELVTNSNTLGERGGRWTSGSSS